MNKITIPFAEWMPDNPDYGGGYILKAINVIPTATGYKPFPGSSPAMNISALPSKVLGTSFFLDLGSLPLTVVGTSTDLYYRTNGDWVNIGSGYSANSWSFALFGSTLIAVNGVDDPQYATIGIDSISDFAPLTDGTDNTLAAPKAGIAAISDNFVILGALTSQKNSVRWSSIGNEFGWPSLGTNTLPTDAIPTESGENIFPDGGNVQAIVQGLNGSVIVFQERAIKAMQYVGSPTVFNVNALSDDIGAIAPLGVIKAKGLIYFLAEDGFYVTNGTNINNIGDNKINNWFRENVDDFTRPAIKGIYDPYLKVIMWAFSSNSNNGTGYDMLLIYNPAATKWSIAELALECLVIDSSRGLTLENLDMYGPLDDLPFSLDSKGLMGGVQVSGYFDQDNNFNYLTGLPMPATLVTNELGGTRALIYGVRPLIQSEPAAADSPIICRLISQDTLSLPGGSYDFSNAAVKDGIHRGHISSRYGMISVEIPSLQWRHALGVELFTSQGSAT